MAYLTLDFESRYLKGNTKIGVILPDKPRNAEPEGFYRNGEKYKVLWLLHGGSGDYSDWIRKSRIELYATEHNLAVVMPSCSNSWYLDWPYFGNGAYYEQFFFKELMPLIYGWFPVSRGREDNFIGGLAMGGRGALKYGMEHPELFAALADISGGLNRFEADLTGANPRGRKRTENLIGMYGSLENLQESTANIHRTAKRISDEGRTGEMPRMYFSVGTNEPSKPVFLEGVLYLRDLGFDFTLEIAEGTHAWEFWDEMIQHAIRFFGFSEEEELGNVY